MHHPSWVEPRGTTVGSAFHEKLIKRSEIAGFMGTSHKERIALNHNNVYRECSNKPSEKYSACWWLWKIGSWQWVPLLRSLSAGVLQSGFDISIFLILIVNCNNVFIVLAFLELYRLLVGAMSKFSVSFLLSSISLHLSSPTDSYSKKILRRRRNCLSESEESTPTFIFYEGGNCLFRATLEGQWANYSSYFW